jgi:hypothetical protein
MILHAQDNIMVDTVVQTVEEQKVFHEDDEENYEEEYEPVADTTLRMHAIDISRDTINSLKNREAFSYVKNLDSLLKASQQKAPEQSKKVSGNSFSNRLLGGHFIKIILWILAIFFIGIIIYQLFKSNGLFQRASAARVTENIENEADLFLHNDFDQLIHQACKLGDYRMGVRYLFLKTLQQLRDKNQINYEPDKTNSRYVYELPEQRRNDFSKLIFQYEYVWYGHFDINKDQYEQVQKGFYNFFQKI